MPERRESARDRQRKARDRRRNGRRVLRVEIDEAALSDVLIATGELGLNEADDPEKLRAAVERHLAGLMVAVIES